MVSRLPSEPAWPNAVTAAIAHLFAHILDRPVPGPCETFDSLGGDAEGVWQIQQAMQSVFAITLPASIFQTACFTPTDLAEAIIAAKSVPTTTEGAGADTEPSDWCPALPTQSTCYFIDQITRGEARPAITGALVIEGPLDRERLTNALRTVWMRHDGVRMRFRVQKGKVAVRPDDTPPVVEEFEPAFDDESAHIHAASLHSIKQLDLNHGHCVHWTLSSLAPDRHILVVVAHHAIADAIARGLLLKEIGEVYAVGNGTYAEHPAPSFVAVAAERNAAMTSPQAAVADAYWRSYLPETIKNLELPGLLGGSSAPACERHVRSYELDGSAVERLLAEAAAHSATPFIAFARLMARCFAREEDGFVLVPVSNRDHAGHQNTVGCLVHTVPLRLSASRSYEALRQDVAQMLTHAVLPVQELIARGIVHSSNMMEAPISTQFQVRRNETELIVERPDLRIRRLEPVFGVNNMLPLSIDIKRGASTVVHCDYDPGLVDPVGLDTMINRINAELETMHQGA